MPYEIKYPEYITDEASGIQVKNRDFEVAKEAIADYTEYLKLEFTRLFSEHKPSK